MNVFIQRAAQYMGVSLRDKLSKTDEKRLRAKAKKMKTSEKKAQRKQDTIILLEGPGCETSFCKSRI